MYKKLLLEARGKDTVLTDEGMNAVRKGLEMFTTFENLKGFMTKEERIELQGLDDTLTTDEDFL